jgi:phosphate transport system substrate-binding protein
MYYNRKMKCLLKKILLIFAICLCAVYSSAAELGYQGTHILTHGALEEVAKAFHKKYGVYVFVKGGGCSDGIAVVIKDKYDMGGLCCPLPEDTAKRYGIIPHKVAVDIKAVMVNKANPIKDLTIAQIADIHTGRITNWKQVGGKNRPIALIYRDHCRDMQEPVRKALGITGPVAKKAIIVKTDKEVVEYVERFSDAVGIAPLVFAQESKVKIISVDKIAATPENTEKGVYPLKGDLYIITKGQPTGLTKKFIDFVLSAEGQSIIGRNFAKAQ